MSTFFLYKLPEIPAKDVPENKLFDRLREEFQAILVPIYSFRHSKGHFSSFIDIAFPFSV